MEVPVTEFTGDFYGRSKFRVVNQEKGFQVLPDAKYTSVILVVIPN
jgi:hypothetical protein